MAILHRATLEPGKAALVGAWLDGQDWAVDGPTELLASYRFDDPEGEVGVEAFLVRRGEQLLHVPVTYRAAPLQGAGDQLVGRTQHSVLGERWVYDAAADPVAVRCFERALRGVQEQAAVEVYDGAVLLERREPTVLLRREGSAPDGAALHLVRVPGTDPVPVGGARLLAAPVDTTILGAAGEAVVAYLA